MINIIIIFPFSLTIGVIPDPKGKSNRTVRLNPMVSVPKACVALLDNKYNDGLKWHDEPCSNRRVLVCEDLPIPNINFVRNQNPGINIP